MGLVPQTKYHLNYCHLIFLFEYHMNGIVSNFSMHYYKMVLFNDILTPNLIKIGGDSFFYQWIVIRTNNENHFPWRFVLWIDTKNHFSDSLYYDALQLALCGGEHGLNGPLAPIYLSSTLLVTPPSLSLPWWCHDTMQVALGAALHPSTEGIRCSDAPAWKVPGLGDS